MLKKAAVISVIILAAAAVSCRKVPVPQDSAAVGIYFTTEVNEITKSLFTPENFHTEGNTIKVFDLFTSGGNSSLYIDGVDARCTADGQWPLEQVYYWTYGGMHAFMSHTVKDGLSGISVDKEGMTVTGWVNSLDNQFDLMYATSVRDLDVEKTAGRDPHRPVELQFKHLFAAVGVSFRNISSMPYTVTDWYFQGISDKGTVVIPFKAGVPDITLDIPDQNAHLYDDVDEGVIRSKSLDSEGGVYYPYKAEGTGENSTGASEYVLVWPHSYEELSDAVFHFVYYSGDQVGEGTAEDLDKQPGKQEITLKLGGDACDFIVNEWKPGTRYMYNITISDNKIYFEVRIVPWINDDVILD